ncbi:MAG: prepilin-type N-terminal cleavage/methylation domain-containing protein [Verrucomicrobiia bacterium]
MMAPICQTGKRKTNTAFTLVEVVMSLAILALAMAGMVYGYVQTNYRAEWSSMSLAVQALTVQSIEQARAARWDVYSAVNPGINPDELGNGTNTVVITTIFTNAVLVPSSGKTMSVTNILQMSTISAQPKPSVRQLRSDSAWYFQRTGKWFTNTVITYRAGN